MDREEQSWTMFAAAALAGGMKAKDAVEAADKVAAAQKSRFAEDREPEKDA